MRKYWQTVAAALFAAGLVVESVQGSPAGMTAARPKPATIPTASANITAPPVPTDRIAAAPRTASATSRNPFKYVANAFSGLRSDKRRAAELTTAPQRKDSISLDSPTGPPSPQLVISLAQLCEQRGDIAQARTHYQQALAAWPGNPELLRAAARMEDRAGQLPVAEGLYQQVVAAHPQNAAALNDLGLCLARQGKLEPSVQALEQAIQLQPEKALYRNNAATVLVEMRHDQRAMAHLSSVHGPADVQFNMGQLMVARNRTADAERYFQAALDMNPGMKEAADALAQLPGRQPNSAWPSVPSVTTEGAPAVVETPAPTAPQAEVPQTAPTMGPQFGPQMSFPSEARAPGYGQSTYMPPAYQSPMGPYPGGYPQPNVPWVGQAPVRSLPPVGTVPAGARR